MKKLGAAVISAVLMLSVATGCGTKNASPNSTSGNSSTPTPVPAQTQDVSKNAQPVTITYESWTPYKEDMDKIVAEFNKVHPEITVDVKLHANFTEYMTAIKTAFASGSAPDVLGFDSPASLSALKSQLQPLDDYASKAWGADWKKKFLAGPVADVTADGKLMGLPQTISPGGFLWYNKTILNKYGIQEPKTYDDLKAAAATLRKNGIQPVLLGAKDPWIVIDTFQTILNNVAPGKQYDAFAKKIPFADPDIIKAFDTWKKMFDDKIFQDDTFGMTEYMDVYNAFIDKQSGAFESNGAWNLDIYGNKDLKAKVDANEWGIMQFPDLVGNGKVAPSLSTVGGVAVSKDSKNKDAAFEFAKFMYADPKGLQIMINHSLAAPAITDKVEVTAQLSPNAKQVVDKVSQLVQQNPPLHRGVDDAKVADKLYDVLTKVAYGKLSSADAAKEVQSVIDAGK